MESQEFRVNALKAGCITQVVWILWFGAWQMWFPGKLVAIPVTMGGALVLTRILFRRFSRRTPNRTTEEGRLTTGDESRRGSERTPR
jgi:hypothetical protein